MPKLTWTVLNGATDISSRVLSMNITQGREKYLDPYSGGTCVFTINNSGDYASGISYGNVIRVTTNGFSDFYCDFWVQEVVFDDYPGNTGLNTATITAVDWISRSGRILANNFSLTQAFCRTQMELFQGSFSGPLPIDMLVFSSGASGGSTAAAITYTGSVNNYLNFLVATERGYLVVRSSILYFIDRSFVSSYAPIATTIGRTTSATQIAYDDFDRIQNGTQFINTATVSPNGLASQTSVNSSSVTTYGAASYSSSTVDFSTTQASGNADWIVNNFSNPSTLRFKCSLTDTSQNATALASWMSQCWGTANRVTTFSYQVPGGSLTSVSLVMEGFSVNITPEQTRFELSFSPLDYYQFFTLNSSTLGILNTSRLGW
jgi:hypothetical protein